MPQRAHVQSSAKCRINAKRGILESVLSRFDVTLLNGMLPQLFLKSAVALSCEAQGTLISQNGHFQRLHLQDEIQ